MPKETIQHSTLSKLLNQYRLQRNDIISRSRRYWGYDPIFNFLDKKRQRLSQTIYADEVIVFLFKVGGFDKEHQAFPLCRGILRDILSDEAPVSESKLNISVALFHAIHQSGLDFAPLTGALLKLCPSLNNEEDINDIVARLNRLKALNALRYTMIMVNEWLTPLLDIIDTLDDELAQDHAFCIDMANLLTRFSQTKFTYALCEKLMAMARANLISHGLIRFLTHFHFNHKDVTSIANIADVYIFCQQHRLVLNEELCKLLENTSYPHKLARRFVELNERQLLTKDIIELCKKSGFSNVMASFVLCFSRHHLMSKENIKSIQVILKEPLGRNRGRWSSFNSSNEDALAQALFSLGQSLDADADFAMQHWFDFIVAEAITYGFTTISVLISALAKATLLTQTNMAALNQLARKNGSMSGLFGATAPYSSFAHVCHKLAEMNILEQSVFDSLLAFSLSFPNIIDELKTILEILSERGVFDCALVKHILSSLICKELSRETNFWFGNLRAGICRIAHKDEYPAELKLRLLPPLCTTAKPAELADEINSTPIAVLQYLPIERVFTLIKESESLSYREINHAISCLAQDGLMTNELAVDSVLASSEMVNMAMSLCLLHPHGMMTPDNIQRLHTHPNCLELARALITINQKSLGPYQASILTHHNPNTFAELIIKLKNKNLLTAAILDRLEMIEDIYAVHDILTALEKRNLLNGEKFLQCLHHPHSSAIGHMLFLFGVNHTIELDEDLYQKILLHPQVETLAQVVDSLPKTITPRLLALFFASPHPIEFAKAMIELHNNHIRVSDILINDILSQANAYKLAKCYVALYQANNIDNSDAQSIFHQAKSHPQPFEYGISLAIIHMHHLTMSRLEPILRDVESLSEPFLEAACDAGGSEDLTDELFIWLLNASNPNQFYQAFKTLKRHELLSDKLIKVLQQHDKPHLIADFLNALYTTLTEFLKEQDEETLGIVDEHGLVRFYTQLSEEVFLQTDSIETDRYFKETLSPAEVLSYVALIPQDKLLTEVRSTQVISPI